MDGLNPAQQRVVTGLMAAGHERPAFDPGLPARLVDLMEERLAGVAAHLDRGELVVNKTALSQVHTCERWHVAQERDGFAWSPRTACGSVAHKAIELGVFSRDDPSPIDLVDRAIARLVAHAGQEPWTAGPYLVSADPGELAEVRAAAADRVTTFLDTFPPLKKRWRPVVESRARVDLCDGRVVLKGKVDLSVGRREGNTARVLLVDFKGGSPHHTHADDLRFYALLETIRIGVPPFRVASYYLESARWHHEDVSQDLLEAAALRVAEGVTRIVELRVDGREPATSPGPLCGSCTERALCPGAAAWEERTDDLVLAR